jgi:dTDP-4-amino-4,6-dideoxygalactose transaminase
LNGKLSEVGALLGSLRLTDYDHIVKHRATMLHHYRAALPELDFQLRAPGIQAHQFVPALLPSPLKGCRAAIRAELAERGIATGTYFSPHLLEQPYFQKVCAGGPLPVCDDVSARMISLPLFNSMTHDEVDQVVASLHALIGVAEPARRLRRPPRGVRQAPLVYAGNNLRSGEITVE